MTAHRDFRAEGVVRRLLAALPDYEATDTHLRQRPFARHLRDVVMKSGKGQRRAAAQLETALPPHSVAIVVGAERLVATRTMVVMRDGAWTQPPPGLEAFGQTLVTWSCSFAHPARGMPAVLIRASPLLFSMHAVRRAAERGGYDEAGLYEVLDDTFAKATHLAPQNATLLPLARNAVLFPAGIEDAWVIAPMEHSIPINLFDRYDEGGAPQGQRAVRVLTLAVRTYLHRTQFTAEDEAALRATCNALQNGPVGLYATHSGLMELPW